MDSLLMGMLAIALAIFSIAFWIIQYFIEIDAVIIIAVIFPCTIFGLILALSRDPRGQVQGIHFLQKIGLIINIAFVSYLIVNQIFIY